MELSRLHSLLARQFMCLSAHSACTLCSAVLPDFCFGGTILISAILLYITLSTTHTALMPLAKLVFLGHIPIAIVEGIISFWLVHFLQKAKPSLLGVSTQCH